MAFKIKVSFFQNPEKNEDMKLKERLVAATFGFSAAIILVFLVESLDLTDNQDFGQDQSHGTIKSSSSSHKSSSGSISHDQWMIGLRPEIVWCGHPV